MLEKRVLLTHTNFLNFNTFIFFLEFNSMTVDHSHPLLPKLFMPNLFISHICVLKNKNSLCLVFYSYRLLGARPPAGAWSSHKILPLKKVTLGLPAALPAALSCP